MGKTYEQLEYTPYGELWVEHLETTIEAMPFRFTGRERDSETGLYYFGARYLNPQTSMWLSADPAMGEYIPQAPNRRMQPER
jgi:RHS repeat-associated protein